jgi:DNA polymerase
MFIGEAPGAEEDKRGEPFVGESGKLLDKMIVAMGWTRESVYIANVLKCRPPENRDPRASEIEACENFLAQQIEAVGPTVIVTLGKPAAHLLLKTSASMGSLRGSWQDYSGIPVMPTYHPAYLLRDPTKKRDVWADLQAVMRLFS